MSVHADIEQRARLALHVLTDRQWSRERSFLDVAAAALAGGATTIQLRDKHADTRTLIQEGLALRELTREHNALLIVNDRIDVALAIDADGAHVGQDDMPGEYARRLLGPDRILGISAGNMDEALAGIAAGADYLGVGPIYATQAKADAGEPIGMQLLTELAKRYTTPLVAIGGITPENALDILQAGAAGIAVIRAVVAADDIAAATRQFVTVHRNAKG
jgi:thiamine-phosphate diphosphorylase